MMLYNYIIYLWILLSVLVLVQQFFLLDPWIIYYIPIVACSSTYKIVSTDIIGMLNQKLLSFVHRNVKQSRQTCTNNDKENAFFLVIHPSPRKQKISRL